MSASPDGKHSFNHAAKLIVAKSLNQSRRLFGSRRARSLGSFGNYFRRTPAIGYAGWIGKANLGDEALYDAFVKLFPDDQLISLNNPFPIELSLHAAVFQGGNIFKGVMLGGGTLIFHKSYAHIMDEAQRNGLPTVVFGTGVINTEFWSANRADKGYNPVQDLWKAVLSQAAYIGVRGPDSDKQLREIGITDHEVIGDPALSICPEMKERKLRERWSVAFNLGNIGPAWGSRQNIDDSYGQTCSKLILNGHSVDFFGLHSSDATRATEVVKAYRLDCGEIWSEYHDTERTLKKLDKYDIVVAQKLHGIVLAAGLGIPCVSVAYEPKCLDFMRSIGMEDCVIQADKLTPEILTNKVNEVASRYNELREILHSHVAYWQKCQQVAAQKVRDVFASGAAI